MGFGILPACNGFAVTLDMDDPESSTGREEPWDMRITVFDLSLRHELEIVVPFSSDDAATEAVKSLAVATKKRIENHYNTHDRRSTKTMFAESATSFAAISVSDHIAASITPYKSHDDDDDLCVVQIMHHKNVADQSRHDMYSDMRPVMFARLEVRSWEEACQMCAGARLFE